MQRWFPRLVLILPLLLPIAAAPLVAGPDGLDGASFVWWEGEAPEETNFPASTWLSAATFPARRDGLSGGDWLTNTGTRGREIAFATWRVRVSKRGTYDLWCRKFWKHGPFRWRFGEQAWATCGRDVALADSYDIRKHLCANWVHLGRVDLQRGRATFRIELLAEPGEELTSAFDCFCLSDGPFQPRGHLKPGERSGEADEGFFAWEPGPDAFTEDALLDLRHLNEELAGMHGRVRRKQDALLLGDQTPVRFWAVNAGPGVVELDEASVRHLARRLAKRGVNMVRYHGPIFDSRAEDPATVDAKRLDAIQRFVVAMKAEGIYTKLSFYFPLWFHVEGKPSFALLYFDLEMQRIHRAWARALLTAKSPYGPPLGKDPAVAIVEIVNEDSLFFWTFKPDAFQTGRKALLEGRFGAWAKGRYGSLQKALRAWDGVREAGDRPDEGRLALYDAWHMTRDGLKKLPRKRKRIVAQGRFLAALQRSFYSDFVAFLRADCAYDGLVSASNWKTADPTVTDHVERWTYTAGDVIDRHGYFGGKHEGEGAGWSVRTGHVFANRAAVKHPEALPIQCDQVVGFPQIVSEIGWTNPNRYRADFAPIVAVYGALQGIDGIFTFALGGAGDDQDLKKFALSCPAILGSFPLWALAYRRGDVAEGTPALERHLTPAWGVGDTWKEGTPAPGFDALRASDEDGLPHAEGGLAFYTGPVRRSFQASPRRQGAFAFRGRIDREKRIVCSMDRTLTWAWGRGLLVVHTQRTKGAVGFLGAAGRVDLGDVEVHLENEYGAVGVTSLDGKPTATSKRLLVQVMTVERPLGFRASNGPDGTILDLGRAPFGVERIRGSLVLRGPQPRARALDENGYARGGPLEVERRSGHWTLRLPEDAVYVIVER